MAANLNQANGQYSFAYNSKRGLPWHGWGQPVEGLMTSEECLIKANLNFDVETAPVYTLDVIEGHDSVVQEMRVPNTNVIRRTDTHQIFTSNGKLVTDAYQTYSNIEAFNFLDSFVLENKAIYETAGALGDGATVFITAALDQFDVVKDTIKPYLFTALNHDGTSSIKMGITDIRIVCANTLNAALESSNCISIVHKGDLNSKVNEAMKSFVRVRQAMDTRRLIYNQMYTVAISDKAVKDLVCKLILTDAENELYIANNHIIKGVEEISTKKTNVIKAVYNNYFNGIGQKDVVGSVWGAYNAITGYTTNVKQYTSEGSKYASLITGNKIVNNAFDLLCKTL